MIGKIREKWDRKIGEGEGEGKRMGKRVGQMVCEGL